MYQFVHGCHVLLFGLQGKIKTFKDIAQTRNIPWCQHAGSKDKLVTDLESTK